MVSQCFVLVCNVGVPKLNQGELETACEDFSNIINSFDECTIYKGTLSSGVEIAVDSTIVTSARDWSKNMETAYRKKVFSFSNQLREGLSILNYLLLILFLVCFRLLLCPVLTIRTLPTLLGTVTKKNHSQG